MKERILARSSSKTPESQKKRWTDVEIVKLERGRYLVREVGRSSFAGETDRVREAVCTTGDDVMAALTAGTKGKLSRTAFVALRDAGKADVALRELVADLMPEDLTPVCYAPRSARVNGHAEAVYVIEYPAHERRRPIRFQGTLLGGGTSRVEGSFEWTTVHIYRTLDGRFVAVKDHRCEDAARDREHAKNRKIAVVRSAKQIVLELTRAGRGWIETALLDALEQARENDRNLDAEIAGDTLEWAEAVIGPVALRPGDKRYLALEYLERGAHLFTMASEVARAAILGFVYTGTENVREPEMSVGLFIALSRQELIMRDREAEETQAYRRLPRAIAEPITDAGRAADVVAWTISPIGREALAAAKAEEARVLREAHRDEFSLKG